MNPRMDERKAPFKKLYPAVFAADNPAAGEDMLFIDMIGRTSAGKIFLIQRYLDKLFINESERSRITVEIGSIARGPK